MKAIAPILLTPEEIAYVYGSLNHYRRDLEKYLQWLKTKEGKSLPGVETAIAEVNKDLKELALLQQRLYDIYFVGKGT